MGDETADTCSWRGYSGSDRDLGSRLKAARQQVWDGRWRTVGWKRFWTGDPRLERGRTIECEERCISVLGWRMGGGVSTRRVKGTDPENSRTVGWG